MSKATITYVAPPGVVHVLWGPKTGTTRVRGQALLQALLARGYTYICCEIQDQPVAHSAGGIHTGEIAHGIHQNQLP